MDRIWQWAWDRHGPRYSWAMFTLSSTFSLPIYVVPAFLVVAFEGSDQYLEAAAVAIIVELVTVYTMALPSFRGLRLAERWAAGENVDPASALEATYAYARGARIRAVAGNATLFALLLVAVGAITGAPAARLIQYAVMGAAFG